MKEIGEGEKGEKVGPATVMRESIEIIKGVLAGDEFEYKGKSLRRTCRRSRRMRILGALARRFISPERGRCCRGLAGAIAMDCSRPASRRRRLSRYSREEDGRGRAQGWKRSVVPGSRLGDRRKHRRRSAKGKEGAREQAAMYLANKVQNIKGSADVLLECARLTFDEIRPIADAMEAGRAQSRC